MSEIVVPALHARGRRPRPRYVPQAPCSHKYGDLTTLEEVAGEPPRAFAGRLRFKNEARVCAWCGLVTAVMR